MTYEVVHPLTTEIIDWGSTGKQQRLLCPACREPSVHIEVVEVGARQEDQAGVYVEVDSISGGVYRSHLAKNADMQSSRRQWVTLVLRCEHCGEHPMTFAQHKGDTFIHNGRYDRKA